MLVSTNRTIQLDQISIHKLSVVVPIKRQIKIFTDIANQSPKTLPLIKVGRIKSKFYIISDFDVFWGIKESKLTQVKCEIIDFKNEIDFIIEHVKINKNPVGFNPLLLYKVIGFLENNQIPKSKALGLLQIYQTTNHKLLDLNLNPKVIEILCNLHIFLAEKLTNFTLPFYIPHTISKYELIKQIEISNKIVDFIKSKSITDSKFSWASVEEIEVLLDDPLYHKTSQNSTISYPKEDSPSKKSLEQSEKIITKSKNVICIPETKNHPAYLVDVKSKNVSEIKEKNTVTLLENISSSNTFILPKKAVDYLDLEESLDVKMKPFTNCNSLIKYLKSHPNIQGVLFYR